MSENDYIAEYIKEKYPALIGFDYTMWKLGRQYAEFVEGIAKGITDLFNSINEEEHRDE